MRNVQSNILDEPIVWCFPLLHAQEKVYQEIRTVMGDKKQVTVDELMVSDDAQKPSPRQKVERLAQIHFLLCVQNFTYLEQCIKETIRVFTVLPATIRCTNEELTISGKFAIQCGSSNSSR